MAPVTDTLRKLVQERVRVGVIWLDAHAPILWRNNMYGIRNDRAVFRATGESNARHVLALAFESQGEMSNKTGYVTSVTVAKAFALSPEKLRELGFGTESGAGITKAILREEW